MKIAVQAVLLDNIGRVLTVSRKDNHSDFGLIGGKVDPEDKSPLEALAREMREETGLILTSGQLIHMGEHNGYMNYTYLVTANGSIQHDEPHIVLWQSFYEILKGSFGDYNFWVMRSLMVQGINFQ